MWPERTTSIVASLILLVHIFVLIGPIVAVIPIMENSSILQSFFELKLEWHKHSATIFEIDEKSVEDRWNTIFLGTLILFLCGAFASVRVKFYYVFTFLQVLVVTTDLYFGSQPYSGSYAGLSTTIVADRLYLLVFTLLVLMLRYYLVRRSRINA